MRLFASFCALLLTTGLAAQTHRQLFDGGWQFTRNGKTTTVNLPHDWDIYEGPNSGKGATGTGGGWFEGGRGEYRKTFATPQGDRVKLHFEGVYQKAEVFVNGQRAGQHGYGYTPFTVDITPFLNPQDPTTSQPHNLTTSQPHNLKTSKPQDLNEVVVKVDNSQQPNCRWYSGSGIYRHVWLETMPALHITENGVFVTTPEVSADKATVKVEVCVQNESLTPAPSPKGEGSGYSVKDTSIEVVLRDLAGTVIQTKSQPLGELGKESETKSVFTFEINNPKLWSPDTPYLYTAEVRLSTPLALWRGDGGEAVNFGIRSFSFDAERGFVLNGRPLLINGACVHHDDGVLGAMAFDDAEIRKVRQMKDAGFNLIRTSHNPTTRAFLDACDSLGVLVICEAFDGWRTQKNPYDYSTMIDSCYREDLHAMVLRDRNHPSIISWSIGNEVIERKDIRVITTARKLKQAILECDRTRPVTEALCAWDRDWEIYDPHAEVLDVVGYNYMLFKHAGDHERDPRRVIWQTESYPRDAFRNWATVQDFPYVVGDIVWTGLDYLGESGIGRNYYKGEREGESWIEGGQPEWHGAPCGDVDITGWRKPISHYREILWTEPMESQTIFTPERGTIPSANKTIEAPSGAVGGAATTLYLCVKEPNGYHGEIKTTMWSVWPTWESWNWPGWEGKPVEVEIYTKAPEVKLYLNDQLIGTKAVSRDTEFKAVFTVNYEPGTLRAEATATTSAATEATSPQPVKGGSSAVLVTAGEPARLRLTPDRRTIRANGQDLAFITVEVIDNKGNVCPEAAIPCEVSISGRGQLLAAASADLKDTEPYPTSHVKTWKGRALLVIRSGQKAGQTKVSIKSPLPTAHITIAQK